MDAIVKSTPKPISVENKVKVFRSITTEFMSLLLIINRCKTEQELRTFFKNSQYEYFMVGFGGNHMWVKQLDENGKTGQEVIELIF